jgi:hypothetical protein
MAIIYQFIFSRKNCLEKNEAINLAALVATILGRWIKKTVVSEPQMAEKIVMHTVNESLYRNKSSVPSAWTGLPGKQYPVHERNIGPPNELFEYRTTKRAFCKILNYPPLSKGRCRSTSRDLLPAECHLAGISAISKYNS